MSENSKIEWMLPQESRLSQCLFPLLPRKNNGGSHLFQCSQLQVAIFGEPCGTHSFYVMCAVRSSCAQLSSRPCSKYLLHDFGRQRLMHRRSEGLRGSVQATRLKRKIDHSLLALRYFFCAFDELLCGINGIANQCLSISRGSITRADPVLCGARLCSPAFETILKEYDTESACDGNQRRNALHQTQPISAMERAHA